MTRERRQCSSLELTTSSCNILFSDLAMSSKSHFYSSDGLHTSEIESTRELSKLVEYEVHPINRSLVLNILSFIAISENKKLQDDVVNSSEL